MRNALALAPLFFLLAAPGLAPCACAAAVTAGPPAKASVAKITPGGKFFFVDKTNGDDTSGDGSRERPWATITHALASIETPPPGAKPVSLLIAAGRYAEPTLVLKPRVNLSGGYAAFGARATADANAPLARDCWETPTILDGEGVRRIAIAADDAKLDGLRFENGVATAAAGTDGAGGALLIDGCAPSLSGCVFVNNRALGKNNGGGAVACVNGAAPYIVHSIMAGNASEGAAGGAFFATGKSAPRLKSVVFFNNSHGGAIAYAGGCGGEITGNILVANQSRSDSAAAAAVTVDKSAPTLTGNIVAGNTPAKNLSGMLIRGASEKPVEMDRNVFAGGKGVILAVTGAHARLAHNMAAENAAMIEFARSTVEAERNTFWQVCDNGGRKLAKSAGNLFRGDKTARFRDDAVTREIVSTRYDAARFVTVITLAAAMPEASRPYEFCARPVRIGDGADARWSVTKSAAENEVLVWGNFAQPAKTLTIMRTYLQEPDAPAGTGADYLILPNSKS